MDTFHLHKWKINTSGGQSGLGPGPVSAALQWRQATRLLLSVEQDSDGEMSLFKQKECVLASVAGISFLTPDGARHVKTSGGCCSRSLSETVALVSQGARITRTRKDVRSRCCLARPVVPGVYAWLESDPVPRVPLLLPIHSCWQSGRVCMCRPPCTSVWFMSSGEHLRTGQVQAQAPALSRGWLGFLAQQ